MKTNVKVPLRAFQTLYKLITAKLQELEKWKNHNFYDTVDNETQEFIGFRWVNSEKCANGKLKVKFRLVTRKDTSNVSNVSPRCSKENLQLILN